MPVPRSKAGKSQGDGRAGLPNPTRIDRLPAVIIHQREMFNPVSPDLPDHYYQKPAGVVQTEGEMNCQ